MVHAPVAAMKISAATASPRRVRSDCSIGEFVLEHLAGAGELRLEHRRRPRLGSVAHDGAARAHAALGLHLGMLHATQLAHEPADVVAPRSRSCRTRIGRGRARPGGAGRRAPPRRRARVPAGDRRPRRPARRFAARGGAPSPPRRRRRPCAGPEVDGGGSEGSAAGSAVECLARALRRRRSPPRRPLATSSGSPERCRAQGAGRMRAFQAGQLERDRARCARPSSVFSAAR